MSAQQDSLAFRASTNNKDTSVINLTAGCLAIVKAISESSVDTGTIGKAAKTFISWLARERIAESQFETWTKSTSNLVSVNDEGCELLESISQHSTKTSAGGVPIVFPFSVGRALASKASHRYLVTTVAIIMSYHDLPFATQTITNMIFDKGGHEDGVDYEHSNVERALLRSVTNKIVESIGLNMVNAGLLRPKLPKILQAYDKGKTVDQDTFAAVAMALHKHKVQREKSSLLIECDQFYGDLVCWLLHHAPGQVNVTIDLKNVYSSGDTSSQRVLTIMIRKELWSAERGQKPDWPFVRVSEGLGAAFQGRFIVDASPHGPYPSTSSVRSPLYAFNNQIPQMSSSGTRLPGVKHSLNEHEIYTIELTVQQLIVWLLELPIKLNEHSISLKFTPLLEYSSQEDISTKIGNLASQWPGLTRIGSGQTLGKDAVYRQTSRIKPNNHISIFREDGSRVEFPGQTHGPVADEEAFTSEDIANCFPSVSVLLDQVKKRCGCHGCRNDLKLHLCKIGCLREAAWAGVMKLSGHAIAECFGSEDVSGLRPTIPVHKQVETLLRELLYDKEVSWDTWFSVASSMHLGCTWPLQERDTDQNAREVVAVQYGATVLIARWMDLSEAPSSSGVFGYDIVNGHIEKLESEHAIVQAEVTARAPGSVAKDEKFVLGSKLPGEAAYQPEMESIEEPTKIDDSSLAMDRFVFNSSGVHAYRMITVVSTQRHRRIINPADGVICSFNTKELSCSHPKTAVGMSSPRIDVEKGSYMEWGFDDLLGEWQTSNKVLDRKKSKPDTWPTTYATQWLQGTIQRTTAMCLSPHGVVIRRSNSSCFQCTIEAVGGTAIEGRKSHARILNVSSQVEQDQHGRPFLISSGRE